MTFESQLKVQDESDQAKTEEFMEEPHIFCMNQLEKRYAKMYHLNDKGKS